MEGDGKDAERRRREGGDLGDWTGGKEWMARGSGKRVWLMQATTSQHGAECGERDGGRGRLFDVSPLLIEHPLHRVQLEPHRIRRDLVADCVVALHRVGRGGGALDSRAREVGRGLVDLFAVLHHQPVAHQPREQRANLLRVQVEPFGDLLVELPLGEGWSVVGGRVARGVDERLHYQYLAQLVEEPRRQPEQLGVPHLGRSRHSGFRGQIPSGFRLGRGTGSREVDFRRFQSVPSGFRLGGQRGTGSRLEVDFRRFQKSLLSGFKSRNR